jgi:hypothetical protein
MLNGGSIKLGTVLDVVDKVHGRRGFEIGLMDGDVDYRWVFQGERTDMSVALTQVHVSNRDLVDEGLFQYLVLRYLLPISEGYSNTSPPLAAKIRNLTYITAERIGPRETYPLLDPTIGTIVGPSGEHTVSLLHLRRDERIQDALVMEGEPPTLLGQVGQRMRQFFPGASLVVERVPQANVVILGLRTSDDTDFHRPVHVGFGLTQILPIIVATLSAKQGDVILIENLEVHLHPSGQAKMGKFLAEVASSGVQVIIETHSDHVLNGIRRSVKAGFPPGDVELHFFNRGRKKDRKSSLHVLMPTAILITGQKDFLINSIKT